MEHLQYCPVCNNTSFESFLTCEDFTVSRQSFHIVTCKHCSFKFTNPRPKAHHLNAYYESNDYISHSNTSQGIINFLYQKVRKKTVRSKVRFINKIDPTKGALLDIGCGTGEFLFATQQSGRPVQGIEPAEKARAAAIEKYTISIGDEVLLNTLPEHNFSVITLWHVLEHVANLNERIEQIKRLLKESGNVVIAVPNCSSLDAKHYKQFWAGYDVPRHLYHFQHHTIEQLFEQHGFLLSQIHNMPFDSFYVSLLSERYKNTRLQFVRGMVWGLLSNISAIFSSQKKYSSQVYVFKNNG